MVSVPIPLRFPQSSEEASFLSALTTHALPLLQYDPQSDEASARMALSVLEAITHHTDDQLVIQTIQMYEQDPRRAVQQRSQDILQHLALPPKVNVFARRPLFGHRCGSVNQ